MGPSLDLGHFLTFPSSHLRVLLGVGQEQCHTSSASLKNRSVCLCCRQQRPRPPHLVSSTPWTKDSIEVPRCSIFFFPFSSKGSSGCGVDAPPPWSVPLLSYWHVILPSSLPSVAGSPAMSILSVWYWWQPLLASSHSFPVPSLLLLSAQHWGFRDAVDKDLPLSCSQTSVRDIMGTQTNYHQMKRYNLGHMDCVLCRGPRN